jgi:hypothetical protein
MGRVGREKVDHLETLMLQSIETFLGADEIAAIDASLARAYPSMGMFGGQHRVTSIHALAGLSAREAASVYEPCGRVEVTVLPDAVTAVLDQALENHMPAIRRQFRSVTHRDAWTYIEYGDTQHIEPHLDFPLDEAQPYTTKVCGISILLHSAASGGEFCIHSCGSDLLWSRKGRETVIPQSMNPATACFREMPKTCWRANQRVGTAILYGSHVIHSTAPVVSGRARKIIGFLHSTERPYGSLHRLSAGGVLS